MAKPKYRLWATILPKRDKRYEHEYPLNYDLNGYVIAACESHAEAMIKYRNLGERLRQPNDATPCSVKNRVVRATPKTLSRFLMIRLERGTPWVSHGMGSYLGDFVRLAQASNAATPKQLAELVHALCCYGCRGRELIEWIELVENVIPGHTLGYAKEYFRANPF